MSNDATPAKVRLTEGLGPLPEREAWVRKWFAEHYQAGDVFYDGAEALTLAAAVQLVADAQAAERERWRCWVEEAVSYFGCETWSPSLKEEGERLLGLRA